MKKIIVINGTGGSGKDTFVSLCKEINSNVEQVSYADAAKDLAIKCGWNGEKEDKDRKFLADLTDALALWKDLPYKVIQDFIASQDDKIIFVHAREPKIIQRLVNDYNATTLLVKRANLADIKTNHADANVYGYNYDKIIDNDSDIQNLKKIANSFLNSTFFIGNRG